MRRAFYVLGLLFIAGALGFSCSTSQVCMAGRSVSCACPDGKMGAQTCRADGQTYSDCVCDSSVGGAGSTSASSTSSLTSTTSATTTASTASTASSSSTGSGSCIPGTVSPCYDGPSGTEGVGICKGGMHMCE